MAYKELKLNPGEAESLYDLWNSGMPTPKRKAKASAKKPTEKKKPAPKKGK